MRLGSKTTGVMVLCVSVLLLLLVIQHADDVFPARPITVALETSPCKFNGSDKIKIALTAEINGTGLRHGQAVIAFHLLDSDSATPPTECQPIEGYTDAHGRFVTNWCPSRPGNYKICADVTKPGCNHGEAVSFVTTVVQCRR